VGFPVDTPDDFALPAFADAVQVAVDVGLDAAAVVDGNGRVLAIAGLLEEDEARATVTHATQSDDAPELLERMRNLQLIRAGLHDRDARIGFVAENVFFVVVFPVQERTSRPVVAELRADLLQAIHRAGTRLLLPPTRSGGPAGPAELPRRRRH
jgi:hypothetical protein